MSGAASGDEARLQLIRIDTGIITAAAFSGQIQPSAWTSPTSAAAQTIKATR